MAAYAAKGIKAHGYVCDVTDEPAVQAMGEPKGGARGPWQKVLHALQEPFKRASAHDERTARQ